MKKNIALFVLSIVSVFFIINGVITKQENEKLSEFLHLEMPSIAGMQLEMSAEYYENFKKLKECNCSAEILDSIWENSEYLQSYKNAKKKVELSKIE